MIRTRARWPLVGVALALASVVWPAPPTPVSAAPGDGFVEVQVARLLDSRPGATTVDGRFAGTGLLGAGEHVAFDVRDRAGVPAGVVAVAVTVTVTEPTMAGFVTLYPCGVVPIASTVNYRAGQTVANSAITGLSADGRLCVHTMSPTHVVVDVTGAFDAGFVPVPNARLLDTRPGEPTGDGSSAGGGLVAANGVVELQVAGRSGVPAGAEAAALTITSTGSTRAGYVTAYPCGPQPLASTLNHTGGENRANSLVVPLDAGGKVCLFTLAPTHLVVDVSGYVPSGSPYTSVTPARLADTRVDGVSIDGACAATGRVRGLTMLDVQVAGRAGVPTSGVGAVVVNVAVLGERRPGFVTLSEGDAPVPLASSANFGAGEVVAAGAVVPVGADGSISLFVNTGVHIVVDVVGWFPGHSNVTTAGGCVGSFVTPTGSIDSLDGTCAVRQNGSVVCWSLLATSSGSAVQGLAQIPGLSGVVEVNGGCARRVDGTVACYSFTIGPVPEPPPLQEVAFTRPAVDLADRCIITADRRVECSRSSDGAVVEVAMPAAPDAFISEPVIFDPPGMPVRRIRNLDGTVTEIVGRETFAVRRLTAYADGVPWSDVDTVATFGCAILLSGNAVCPNGEPLVSEDVVVDVGKAALRGDGTLRIAVPTFQAESSAEFVDWLAPDDVVFVAMMQYHPSRGALLCIVSSTAALTCGDKVFDANGQGFIVEGILMPE